jgi:hypothetical protein
MVRAILAGTKTQTRRVVKRPLMCLCNHPIEHHIEHQGWTTQGACAPFQHDWFESPCPYGQPGDRLWVRETFTAFDVGFVTYRADFNSDPAEDRAHGIVWTPSIHMPRWASRITLEIVSVRVERLQDISRGDAMAEGCPFPNMANGDDPRQWYAGLWEQINGPGSWEANPWVWVVEFKRVGA